VAEEGAERVVKRIRAGGVIAILRLGAADDLVPVAEAIGAGGVRAIEFTLTTPGAVRALGPPRARRGPEVALGVGTVLTREQAEEAIAAGAQFVVAPNLCPAVIDACRAAGVPAVPGAFSPTEVAAAWDAGASLVKVFPVGSVGPRYIRDLRGPFPHIPMVPTGGVSLEGVAAFLQAGAAAVGVGGEMIPKDLLARRAFDEITIRARAFAGAARQARPTPPAAA
jgi:2-dehydro-3-deoxyphosphogluconate aldolase/(4S)-4-hydroxy-2-oxoglutarate aldolase